MKLIDADRLLEPRRIETYYHLKNGDIAIPLIDIKHAPTIEERKKGKWEMLQIPINPPIYKCSICGKHALETMTGCIVNRHFEACLTDYCPHCGADMKQGEQENV